ncbi:MAG: adenylate/guanylate cyclase domain-containing protein [Pseudomonadota bacterium]|nr:adenylate/guanylate cyclase domain-containing protein [Pseudomonadota bacterium]
MRCPECQHENVPDRSFCAKCGTRIPTRCPRCGFRNEASDRYCGGCGTPLTSPDIARSDGSEDPRPGPDRRQLTVMFCDLVGWTALSARLDPEDLRGLVHHYRDICTRRVSQYDGFVSQFLGDGVLAYFGYPRAHEDDAERAARTGLDIVANIPALTQPGGITFSPAVRIGIATGLVVAGDTVSEGASSQQAVVGETPNLASRLQQIARPNTVVVSESTRRLLRGAFRCECLGSHNLKGFDEGVTAYRVVRPIDERSRFEALHGRTTLPLVGREPDLDLLRSCWAQARQGKGRAVVVVGEPGIGKSRLCRAFTDSIAEDPHHVIDIQCSPHHSKSAFHPLIVYLERNAGILPQDSAEHKLQKIDELLRGVTDTPEQAIPLISSLLSVPEDGQTETFDLSASQIKQRILSALVNQLEGLASVCPVLVEVEDLQWIDPTSEELLNLGLTRCKDLPVMIIATSRPGKPLPDTGPPHIHRVTLTRLNQAQCRTIAANVSDISGLPEEILRRIARKTDGIPLYVEELTKMVLTARAGSHTKDDGETDLLRATLNVPESLKDSLMARLDQLSSVKEIAQIGAVIGREFPLELLAQIAGMPRDRLNAALAELLQAEILVRGMNLVDGTEEFTFRHALLQEAAYESLLLETRRALHERIAGLLQARFRETAQTEPELVAHHFTEAARVEPALAWWARAGRRALERSANFEAISHAERALRLLSNLPGGTQADAAELGFQLVLGTAHRACHGFASQEMKRAFVRAEALCERIGDSATLKRIEVLRGLYSFYYARGDLRAATALSRRLIDLATRFDPDSVVVGKYMLGGMQFWQGNFLAARETLEKGRDAYDPSRIRPDSLSAQSDPGAFNLFQLSWTLWMLGYPDQAIQTCEQVLAMARALRQPFTMAMALFWVSATFNACGKLEESMELNREMREIATEHQLSYLFSCATVLQSHQLITTRQNAKGFEALQGALCDFRRQGAAVGVPWALSMAIEASTGLGDFDTAGEMLRQAREAIEHSGERHWEAEIDRLEGEFLMAIPNGDREEGERRLRRAQDVARRQGARSLLLRSTLSIAGVHRARGDIEGALREIREVYAGFDEGFGTADLVRAETMMRALQG